MNAKVIFNHKVLRDPFVPLYKAKCTSNLENVELSVKFLVSSMHKIKRLFLLFNIQLFKLVLPRLFFCSYFPKGDDTSLPRRKI